MGMFDHINVSIKCPECDTEISDFQSKDSYCVLELIDPTYVDMFYAMCHNCNSWIQFDRVRTREARNTRFSREEVENLGFKLTISKGYKTT